MMVLGIYGSPRKRGNTDLMLDAFLDGAKEAGSEVRRIYVRDMDIGGCLACGHCDKAGTCIQKDAMADVYPLMEEADRIAVASPIYFYGVTGQLKLLVDRSQAAFMKHQLMEKQGKAEGAGRERKGFLLSAGATKGKRLFECAVLCIKYFFDAVGVDYAGDICLRGLEDRGDVQKDPQLLEDCRRAGFSFASGSA